jgi:hypothetical protein
MRQSKNLAMMFLLGAFLVGGALGFSADRYIHRDQVCTTKAQGSPAAGLLDILATRLRLDSAQSQAVDAILDERAAQYKKAWEPLKPRMDSIKENSRSQIRRLLTPEQIREFEALLVEFNDSTRKHDEES